MSEVQNNQATADVQANFDNTVEKIPTKFSFRKVVTKDEATGVETENKRATIEVDLPLISIEGIVAALKAGGKQLDLVLEACRNIQLERAREIVNDDEKITKDNFPVDQLAWAAIAELPKAERRGGGISKEVWEEFAKDYVAAMPAIANKTEEQVKNAAKIYLNKFQQAKTNKPVLNALKSQLALYVSNAPNAEQYSECVEFLVEKADKFLNLTDADLLAAL